MEAAERESRIEKRGELLSALTRELIALHKKYFGRGATSARAIFAHRNLLLVEMEDAFLPVERTMVERGETEIVRQARRTFQTVMRDEFVETVEGLVGRPIENYESVTFTAPDRILEVFYFEPEEGGRAEDDGAGRQAAISGDGGPPEASSRDGGPPEATSRDGGPPEASSRDGGPPEGYPPGD